MNKHLTFRKWLISQLKVSHWARSAEPLETLAIRLGVQPDVLVEAQQSLEEDLKKVNAAPLRIGSAHRSVKLMEYHLELPLPPVVKNDWVVYCQSRNIEGGTLLRSLINRALLTGENPALNVCRFQGWIYRGKQERLDRMPGYKREFRVRSTLPRGAAQALAKRCQNLKVSRTGFLRGLVLDLLEGRTTKLLLVSVQSMSGDPASYIVE